MAGTTFLQLIGSPSENFYLLGKEDKLAAPRPSLPLASPPPHLALLNFFLKTPVKTLLHAALERYPTLKEHLTAYAEGREEEVTSIAWPLALPDFYPLLLRANQELPLPLASAATFLLPYENGLAHFKTHNTSYALNENQKLRLINFAAPHYPGILTWSYPGHPYPQGQAWTTEGLCASWHYLPTDKFNPHGQMASELIWQVLNNTHDLKSVQVFLKTCQVFAALSIILTDQKGNGAQIILEGDRKIWRKIKTSQALYFNRAENLPLKANSLLRPLKEHYRRQKRWGQKFMAQKQNLGLADFWPSLLADQGPEKEKGAMPFLPLTTTAIAAVLPQEQRLCFVDLQNPQPVLEIFSGPQDFGQVVANQSIQDQDTANLKMDLLLRNKISRESLVLPPFTPSPLKPFLGAVQALQNRDYQGAAPYFDLAVNQAQGDEKNLALFFQYLNQYFILSPRRKKSWMALKEDLRTLRHKLPPALQDHVTLFILRINRLIDEKAAGPQLHSLALRRVWRYEQHLPPAIFLQVTRFLTQLRPDVLDVIYPHAI